MSTRGDAFETGAGVATDSAVAPFVRRAPRISQADVFRAADELLLEGHRPTIDRVRMKLGRGSPNTINDHLDAWWAKLGARLRDLPGQEFPALPERVAHALQQLWTEALDGARATLQGALLERERSVEQREAELNDQIRQLADREQAAAASKAALKESLTLAREQLDAANQRAQNLERTLEDRNGECVRLREQVERLDGTVAETRAKLDAAAAAHHAERGQLQESYTAAENRWLREVDRARQQIKDAAREHEHQLEELRRRIEALGDERDQLQRDVTDRGTELRVAAAVREQLEERLREGLRLSNAKTGSPSTSRGKSKRARRGGIKGTKSEHPLPRKEVK